VGARTDLLEREAELRALGAALDGVARGEGAVVTITAPAGMGKTRLIRASAVAARERGLDVLAARGSELERAVPLAVVRELLGDPPPADAGELLPALFRAVAARAERRPLAMLVDDLHWADDRSAEVLVFLAARATDLPVALVVASRPGAVGEPGHVDHLADAADSVVALRPPPLSVEATRRELRRTLGKPVDPAFAGACHSVTGGNPFYVSELALELAAEGVRPTAEACSRVLEIGPDAISRTTLVRLSRLSPDAVTVARAVAALGDGARLRDVAGLAGLDTEATGRALAALIHDAVLADERPPRFAHPVVRTAILTDLTAAGRAALHARAATVLHEHGSDPERVGAHLLECDPGATGPWAAGALAEAAAAARVRDVPELAARLLRRALAEPGAHDRAALERELGAAAFACGQPDALAHLRAALASAPDPAERARCALALALPLCATGCAEEAVAVLGEVAGGPLSDEVDAELSGVALLVPAVAEPVMRELLERADGGNPRVLANLAQWKAMTEGHAAPAAELAARALVGTALLDEAGPSGPALAFAVLVLISADRFAEADRALDAALEVSRRGSLSGFVVTSMMRSLSAFRQGRLDDAVAEARAATDAALAHGWGDGLPATTGFLVDALIERGELDEAALALAQSGIGEAVPDSVLAHAYLVARGRLRLARGELAAGIEDLEELGRRTTGDGWSGTIGTPTFRAYLAPALHVAGETARALELADEELALARAWGARRAIGAALRGRAAVSARGEAIELLQESARVLDGAGAPLEQALTLAGLGAALRREGRAADAREPLRLAVDLAHRCGAGPLLAFAQDELAATGARRRNRVLLTGVEALTPSERRIAAMAADGLSNAEIARALFLTRKTIEMHLSRSYRKLGISSRDGLEAALATGTPD
jgi:DNA-binding CsgD family transcriptional regulator